MLIFFSGVERDFEYRAAEATLLALHETLASSDRLATEYCWLPNPVPMPRSDALRQLIIAPKPLTCFALPLSGALAIAAWPTPRPMDGHPGAYADKVRRINEGLPVPGLGAEWRVLLGSYGAVRLTHREFRLWTEAYELPGVDIVDSEDPRSREYDAVSVTTFRPACIGREGGGVVQVP